MGFSVYLLYIVKLFQKIKKLKLISRIEKVILKDDEIILFEKNKIEYCISINQISNTLPIYEKQNQSNFSNYGTSETGIIVDILADEYINHEIIKKGEAEILELEIHFINSVDYNGLSWPSYLKKPNFEFNQFDKTCIIIPNIFTDFEILYKKIAEKLKLKADNTV